MRYRLAYVIAARICLSTVRSRNSRTFCEKFSQNLKQVAFTFIVRTASVDSQRRIPLFEDKIYRGVLGEATLRSRRQHNNLLGVRGLSPS